MADCHKSRIWLNAPEGHEGGGQDQAVLECEYRMIVNDGDQSFSNLYLSPKRVSFSNGFPPQAADGVSIADVSPPSEPHKLSPESKTLHTFLWQHLASRTDEAGALVFQIPKENGFVAHADPWAYRVANCALVSTTQSFLTPLGPVTGYRGLVTNAEQLIKALEAAVGAVKSRLSIDDDFIQPLEIELTRRLSFPWLSSEPVRPRRLCVALESSISLTATLARWQTAAALGVKIVALGPRASEWWADDNPFAYLREGTIDVDVTPDDGLVQRIVDGVKAYPAPIDGICCMFDVLLVPAAAAAEILGLWTDGPEPFSYSTNKFLTRQLLDPESKEHWSVTSVEELEARLGAQPPVRFPVVCKPFRGCGSMGVFRAEDAEQLRYSVSRTLATGSDPGVLIEPYVNDPEVDCNIVLLDGQVVFAEIVDDYPSEGDLGDNGNDKLFGESEAVTPSRLPADEQKILIDGVHDVILRQGFKSGVFHCEARARNSSMTYVFEEGSSIPELQYVKKSVKSPEPVTMYLHEVNARVPGSMSAGASMVSRGVEWWGLQVLCGLADWQRYEAFAAPFLHDEHINHLWVTNAIMPVTFKGFQKVFPGFTEDTLDHQLLGAEHSPILALAKDYGHLTRHILRHNTHAKQAVKFGLKEGDWLWLGSMLIRSPISRRHARQVAEEFVAIYRDYVKTNYDI
ncbi:putative carnosine synthase 1, partial [Xylariomycetidae sp. FL2044]